MSQYTNYITSHKFSSVIISHLQKCNNKLLQQFLGQCCWRALGETPSNKRHGLCSDGWRLVFQWCNTCFTDNVQSCLQSSATAQPSL